MIWVGFGDGGLDQFNPVTGSSNTTGMCKMIRQLEYRNSYRNFKGSPGDTLGWYA